MAKETNATSSATPPPTSNLDQNSPDEAIGEKTGDVTSQGNTTAEDAEDHGVKEVAETNGNRDAAAPTNRETEIVDMEEAERVADPAESGSPPGIPANGTPASSKKAIGSTKKKSSAVPEHKSKKLNKKKSRPLTNLNAQPGEYYFARMKGHPPWPSIICDEEMLPQSLLDTRPVTTKLPDGTYKKPEYADGGKRAHERTFPVMFLHTNEFAWMLNTDLSVLDPEAVSKASEKGKVKALNLAYEKAAEQHDLNYFKGMLVDHQKAIQEDQEAQAEREAKKLEKAKRKSLDAAQATEGDSMDVDEDVPEPKPKTKKRKKEIDSDGADEKPAKTPKTATKLKLSTPKTPVSEPTNKGRTTKAKAKAVRKASASGDEADDTPKTEQAPLTPAAAKEMKEKKVLFFRHKLQRGFISRDTMPKEDEMKSMSDFLSELEAYPDLEGSIIRATKIHKVLKAMIKLPSIPLDEEFDFRTRSHDLLAKWNEILSNDTNAVPSAPKGEGSKTQAPAKTNGAIKGSKAAKKAEAGEGAAPEEESNEALKKKIGTNVEGEEEATKAGEADGDEGVENGSVNEKLDAEAKTDEPNIESAPAEAYHPPAEDVETSD